MLRTTLLQAETETASLTRTYSLDLRVPFLWEYDKPCPEHPYQKMI